MTTTKFDICSRALLRIGGESIQSFEDDTNEAEIASVLYEGERDAMLSSYYWNFVESDFALSREVDEPDDGRWKYQFTIPVDCLEVTNVVRQSDGSPVNWKQQGGRILANEDSLLLKYRTDGRAEDDFPAYFQDALVSRLAYVFASAMEADENEVGRLANEAQIKERNARAVDARSNPPRELIGRSNSAWVAALRGA